MSKEIDVVGGFKTTQGATNAADRLVAEGFDRDAISIVLAEQARQEFVTVKDGNKGLEGAAAGGAAGGVAGAVFAGLAAAATVIVPGLGLAVAGPLVAAFAGGGAGATAGGIIGGLVGLGMREHEAKLYEKTLKEGGVLVAVRVSSTERAKRAQEVLSEVGALRTEMESGHAIHA
ncbi:MAG: hypothetical protein KC776_09325 [Myxococcales bacterium]|nr:hypothetical protein [Myxococcales bacterium]MCB9581721.1 hypothetical protein [Polyangiaceae bacterium]